MCFVYSVLQIANFSFQNLNKYIFSKWINLNIVFLQGKYILKKLAVLTGETLYTMLRNHHILAVWNKFDTYFVSKYFVPNIENIENSLIIGTLSSLLSS